jgi:hypothetical protein
VPGEVQKLLISATLETRKSYLNIKHWFTHVGEPIINKLGESTVMKNMKFIFASILSIAYLLIWTIVLVMYFWQHNFDVLWLFGIFTVPASLISSEASNLLTKMFKLGKDWGIIFEFTGFLIFGTLQFWVIGYFVGVVWQGMLSLIRGRKTC